MKGEGKVKGSDDVFKFSAPVSAFKVEVELVAEEQEDILKYNDAAKKPELLPFAFEIGDVTFEGFPEVENADYIKSQLTKKVVSAFHRTYEEIGTVT